MLQPMMVPQSLSKFIENSINDLETIFSVSKRMPSDPHKQTLTPAQLKALELQRKIIQEAKREALDSKHLQIPPPPELVRQNAQESPRSDMDLCKEYLHVLDVLGQEKDSILKAIHVPSHQAVLSKLSEVEKSDSDEWTDLPPPSSHPMFDEVQHKPFLWLRNPEDLDTLEIEYLQSIYFLFLQSLPVLQ